MHLERQRIAGGVIDDAVIRELRREYGVTEQEHAAVVDRLLQSRDGVAHHFGDLPAAIEWSAAASERLSSTRSAVARFLVRLLRRRWRRAAESLVLTLCGDAGPEAVRDALGNREQVPGFRVPGFGFKEPGLGTRNAEPGTRNRVLLAKRSAPRCLCVR